LVSEVLDELQQNKTGQNFFDSTVGLNFFLEDLLTDEILVYFCKFVLLFWKKSYLESFLIGIFIVGLFN